MMATVAAAGMISQVIMATTISQPALYLEDSVRTSAPRDLLFAVLAVLVQAVVNEKHVATARGTARVFLDHLLVVPGASSTSCSSMDRARGGPTRTCAALEIRLSDGRGSSSTGPRGRCARCRVSIVLDERSRDRHSYASRLARSDSPGLPREIAATAIGLIVSLGGFIFYNANVLNEYRTKGAIGRASGRV